MLISDTEEARQLKERKNFFKELSNLDDRFALLLEENKIIEKMESSKIFTLDDISTLKEGLTNQEHHLLESTAELFKKIQDNLNSLSK